jgi:hypothetical protein
MCNLGQAVYDNGVRDGVVIGEAREKSRGLAALVCTLRKYHGSAQEVYNDVIENDIFSNVTLDEVTKLYNQN